MRDIGAPGGGKRVLLMRGMNYHTTGEEMIRRLSHEIARLVGKPGRERDAETAIVRVVRIVDRETRNSWGFGFVELATPEVSFSCPGRAASSLRFSSPSLSCPFSCLPPASRKAS